MKIYDYAISGLVEVTDGQYEFMQAVIKYSGRMEEVYTNYTAASRELVAQWLTDPMFKQLMDGYITVLCRSRGLTPEYLKSELIQTIAGQKAPTKAQMSAINASIKALGMGMARTGFSGKVDITPESTQIVFNDGLDEENRNKH
jgi:hypothetical protein